MRKKKIGSRVLACVLLGTIGLTGCGGKKTPDLSNIRKVEVKEEKETEREIERETRSIEKETEKETQREIDKEKESVINEVENSLNETEETQESLGSIGDMEDYTHSDTSNEDYYENKFLYDIGDVLGEDGNYMVSMISVLKGESNYIGDFKQELSKEEAAEIVDRAYRNVTEYQGMQMIGGMDVRYDRGNTPDSENTDIELLLMDLTPDATVKLEVALNEMGEFDEIGSESEMCLVEDGSIRRITLQAGQELDNDVYNKLLDYATSDELVETTLSLENFPLESMDNVINFDSTKLLYGHKSTDKDTSIIVINSDILNAEIILFVEDDMPKWVISRELWSEKRNVMKYYLICRKDSESFNEILEEFLYFNTLMDNEISEQTLIGFDENADESLKSGINWDYIKAEWKKQ